MIDAWLAYRGVCPLTSCHCTPQASSPAWKRSSKVTREARKNVIDGQYPELHVSKKFIPWGWYFQEVRNLSRKFEEFHTLGSIFPRIAKIHPTFPRISYLEADISKNFPSVVVEIHGYSFHPGVVGVPRIVYVTLVNLEDKKRNLAIAFLLVLPPGSYRAVGRICPPMFSTARGWLQFDI